MYWAVRQICMAKHLRSREWWGGWFTGQPENVHNGRLSLRTHAFTCTLVQLPPGLIDRHTFLFSTADVFSPRKLHDPLLSFLQLFSASYKVWGDVSRKDECVSLLEGKTRRGPPLWRRPFARLHALGIIRIYVCFFDPISSTSLLQTHQWSGGFTRAWLIPECVWSQWFLSVRFMTEPYSSSLPSSLVCPAPGLKCTRQRTYFFVSMLSYTQTGARTSMWFNIQYLFYYLRLFSSVWYYMRN